MRLELAIAALETYVAVPAASKNLLGSIVHTAYGHLFEAAGAASRPTTVPRCCTRISTPSYLAPTAPPDEHAGDLALRAVATLLGNSGLDLSRVAQVIHAQCTLDQQIVGSTCLRIQHEHLRHARSAFTIGQLGTAGIPTALRLAALPTAAPELTSISACDKWLSPFYRRLPGVVTYGDAAAACLAGPSSELPRAIAVVESVVTSQCPPLREPWTLDAQQLLAQLQDHASDCIERLLRERPDLDRNSLAVAGDGYGEVFQCGLAQRSRLMGTLLAGPYPEHHLSAAAPLVALASAVAHAARERRVLHSLIWTVCPSGHAAALIARCSPDAVSTNGGWIAAAA